ncbi:DUF5989 family protein [Motiliproteus sp. MSK22-1]|uniref:DUF5989 family protein n=1 Tax=Motiliproteus sp. MSK22-1 TaxID=1897630 RepID=UPI001E50EF61|nr:DUF5989 family protein [Motiliproteus sp. MSK22-1]
MFEFFLDLWLFARKHKKFWVIPIILMLMLVGGLILFTESSVISPFIYTLF